MCDPWSVWPLRCYGRAPIVPRRADDRPDGSVVPMTITDVFRLTEARVCVIGDIILDEYLEGRVKRISPEAPVPVLVQEVRRVVLGGAANVAANVTALGGRAHLVGRVGADRAGDEVRQLLEGAEIGHDLV